MRYTSHGYMTGLDLADHHALYDTGPHPECPGHDEDGQRVVCSVNDQCPGEDDEDTVP